MNVYTLYMHTEYTCDDFASWIFVLVTLSSSSSLLLFCVRGWRWFITNNIVRFYLYSLTNGKNIEFLFIDRGWREGTWQGGGRWKKNARKKSGKQEKTAWGEVRQRQRCKSFETRTKTRSQINAAKLNRSQGNIKPRVHRGPLRVRRAGSIYCARKSPCPVSRAPCIHTLPECTTRFDEYPCA